MRIIYIDIDSMRADHLGCYGYARPTTPHIDALAAQGLRFMQCYVSDVPCLPSRTAFFGGRLGINSGVVNHGGTLADVPVDGPARAFTINTNDQIRSADEYGNIIVAYRNGSPVRMKDVATLVAGAENSKLGGWMNNTPALILNVQRQPGANVIKTVDRIKKLMPQLQAALPPAVKINVVSDRTQTIRASVASSRNPP